MKARFNELFQRPWAAAAILLLAALFAINVYRAATQSISHDEAVIYEWLLSGSWGQVLTYEHGNHHVVSDLLCKLAISVFGLSEFSLRLPSLLGGLLYFYFVFRICRLLFGEKSLLLLSVVFLSLNPFVLDYLVCARGYGLALAFFFGGICYLLEYFAGPASRLLNKAGIALGLSIGTNVIMIFPGISLGAALLILLAAFRKPAPPVEAPPPKTAARVTKKDRRRASKPDGIPERPSSGWSQALLHFVLPAAAVGGFFSILPNRLIELEQDYMGPASLLDILEGLVRNSLYHSASGFAGLAALFKAETVLWVLTRLVAPCGLAALLLAAIRILTARDRGLDDLSPVSRCLLLLTGTLAICIALIFASRHLFERPYPELRTAMYLIPIFSLAILSAVAWLAESAQGWRALSVGLGSIVLLCVGQYLTQFNTRYFAEWAYCAAGKDMMQAIRSDRPPGAASKVKIGATWQLEPVINFYRAAWGLEWLEPVYRESPAGSFDYYVLAFGDTALVKRLNLTVLQQDRLAGTILAK